MSHREVSKSGVNLWGKLGSVLAHGDPLTRACNRLALIVAWNQPLYPIYVWWLVGGSWWISFWTFLSTPLFAGVPIIARRSARAGRAMLPLTGVANGLLSAKAFGEASGVELFLVPCALISLLAFRKNEWRTTAALLAAILCAALVHGYYGVPLGHFEPAQYQHFRNLNRYSVAGLSAVALWTLGRARSQEKWPKRTFEAA